VGGQAIGLAIDRTGRRTRSSPSAFTITCFHPAKSRTTTSLFIHGPS
jgi:hypothetical protein